MCGANGPTTQASRWGGGSSPRVRGKLLAFVHGQGAGRIIPACAGQTVGQGEGDVVLADHPRVCGANPLLFTSSSPYAGSSPRVRGKPYAPQELLEVVRIIPACAGQTSVWIRSPRPESDHPRVCGANLVWVPRMSQTSGSSPRVRGKHFVGIQNGTQVLDHPRVCGANRVDILPLFHVVGSSPRVRGKQAHCGGDELAERIIPACAGQTAVPDASSCLTADHPRVCGANSSSNAHNAPISGSSPRVRGKLWLRGVAALRSRIIPACAGQTATSPLIFSMTTDHPRVCGANLGRVISGRPFYGSSPRVRGKLRDLLCRHAGFRIIPACAGQTCSQTPSRDRVSDHPRVCGANPVVPHRGGREAGSSPRVRGKQFDFTEKQGREACQKNGLAHLTYLPRLPWWLMCLCS